MKRRCEFNVWFWYVLGIILSCLSLGLVFWLFYEYFFERHYWFNRRLLYRRLKDGYYEVVSTRMIPSYNIEEHKLKNGSIWVYLDHEKVTFNESKNDYPDYVGLFTQSPIMKRYNKKIIKLLYENRQVH